MMRAAPCAESVGNGNHRSDREDGDLLTAAQATTLSDTLRLTWRGTLRPLSPTLAALVIVSGAAGAVALAGAPPAGGANWSPVHPGDFPDPSVLQWEGVYYGFATQSFSSAGDITNIQVSTSLDGVNWTASGIDALPTLPSWAEVGDTWAPSVAYSGVSGDFVMYYTATEASTGDQCIGVATSGSPTGPYTDANAAPVVCDNGVDSSTTTSTRGTGAAASTPTSSPMTRAIPSCSGRDDGNHMGVIHPHRSVPLTPDLLAPAGQPTTLLWDDAPWQSNIIEGPDMVENQRHNYYLFYAGSDEGASTYAIGWASCPSGPSAAAPTCPRPVPCLPRPRACQDPAARTCTPCRPRPARHGLRRLAGDDHRLPQLRLPAHVPGHAQLRLAGRSALAGAGDEHRAGRQPELPGLVAPRTWDTGRSARTAASSRSAPPSSTAPPDPCRLNKPVVGMAATPDGGGYWLVASDGGVFAYGDAQFYGSTGSITLNKPIIGMIPSLDGKGYWLIASDGGVFAYGDAENLRVSRRRPPRLPRHRCRTGLPGRRLLDGGCQRPGLELRRRPLEGQPAAAPGWYTITGMAGTQNSSGYWLASANGNVADFGDAAPYGSMYGTALNAPVVGITATNDGAGYWLQGSDGGIFTFGNAQFYGSMGGRHLNAPMVGIAAT